MLKTEKQRAWWFATHPEYSDGRGVDKPHKSKEAEHGQPKVPPEEVDAAVDRALLTATGAEAALLKSIKRNFGTEGYSQAAEQRLAYADEIPAPSDTGEGGDKKPTLLDCVLKGMDNALHLKLPWDVPTVAITKPSRTLGRNLEKAGRPRPPDHAAHHIVSTRDSRFPEADKIRKILNKFKVDINDPANGVWLPNKPGIKPGTYHPPLHGSDYYKEVFKLLNRAKNRRDVIRILESIGRKLAENTFLK